MERDLIQRAVVLLVVIVGALLFLAPTAFRETLADHWPLSQPLALGLDLKGGVHLVYEVKSDEAVIGNLRSMTSAIRSQLREEKIPVRSARVVENGIVEVALLNAKAADRAKEWFDKEYSDLTLVDRTGADNDTLRFTYPEAKREAVKSQAVAQAIETIRSRVDQFGVAEPLLQRGGTSRILLQMPGVTDVEKVKRLVGKVAKLEFRLVPEGAGKESVTRKNRSGETIRVDDEVLMTGSVVDKAQMSVGAGEVAVLLTFNREGARLFRRITSENVGRRLAIILDDTVYSDPVIREAIPGGTASISGGFTVEEAQQLSVVLKAGALPAPLEVLEERSVGPTLGQESIRKGIIAISVSMLAISLFMVWYYKKSGVIAVASLLLNLLLILASLSFFGATLTLPGLAGLALTIGMAVDSNIIIFERIRDELKNGATRDAAVAGGFEKASGAIIDANVTGIISGIILYYFGTGPIRGFAVSTTLGMITTIFCAVFASRLAFDYFSLKGKDKISI